MLIYILCLLSGCNSGEKSVNVSIIYSITVLLSVTGLVAYCAIPTKKELWFICLFSAILVVNIGYLALSLSRSLTMALWANRLSYLGSVMLPLSMMMIILNTIGMRYCKKLPTYLLGISALVFLVAASPGILTIYYKEVSFQLVNGVGTLDKVYGSWHHLYLVYLIGYFIAMIVATTFAISKKKLRTPAHCIFLVIAVFVNLVVWLTEQFVDIGFEVLSVSYIISVLFLLALKLLLLEQQKLLNTQPVAQTAPETTVFTEDYADFCAGIPTLTKTERMIFDLYTAEKSTKEIMEQLQITQNTLKFHNKNIYGKLGVNSRKQLVALYKKSR